jgi:hypothetical protein
LPYIKSVVKETYFCALFYSAIYALTQLEIAERIQKGNRAYYPNAKLLKSRLLKRSTKMRTYLTLIRPVVTCL